MNWRIAALAALSIVIGPAVAAPVAAPAVAVPPTPAPTPGEALIDAMFPLPLIRQLIDQAVEPVFARDDKVGKLPPELRQELIATFVTAINEEMEPKYAAFREANAARLSAVYTRDEVARLHAFFSAPAWPKLFRQLFSQGLAEGVSGARGKAPDNAQSDEELFASLGPEEQAAWNALTASTAGQKLLKGPVSVSRLTSDLTATLERAIASALPKVLRQVNGLIADYKKKSTT